MPYGLVLVAAVIVLAARHARLDGPSKRSKYLVCGGAVASVVGVAFLPGWGLPAAAAQLGVCGYVILHATATGIPSRL